MNVEVDGRKYSIEFEYGVGVADYAHKPSRKASKERRRRASLAAKPDSGHHEAELTQCVIRDVTGFDPFDDEAAPPPVVATGTARRFYTDPENRELGRKHALKKALEALFPSTKLPEKKEDRDPAAVARNAENAARRKLVWDAYHGRRPAPEWATDARVPEMVRSLLAMHFKPEDLRAVLAEQRRRRARNRREQQAGGGSGGLH